MRVCLITHAALLRRLDEKQLKVTQKRYKLDHDKNVNFEPTYLPNNYVLVDRLPATTSAAKVLAAEG